MANNKDKIKSGKDKGETKKIDESKKTKIHKTSQQPDNLLKFSFRHFSFSEKFFCPDTAQYLKIFLERLREVSSWTIDDFRTKKTKSLRNHTHDWENTTEPNGYTHLSQQLQECEPWQFCLTANAYGRVHGLLIDEVFYIVWLDVNHALYS